VETYVNLTIFNLLGEAVTTLVNTYQKAGKYTVVFNAKNLASGLYVYRIETPNFTSSQKLILMK